MQYLAIFIGGGLGSLLRFGLSKLNLIEKFVLPMGTILANILSCVILGYIMGYIADKNESLPNFKAFFAIGFCGGFSTFSTFSLETFTLLQKGEAYYAIINVGLSIVLCTIALYLGFYLSKTIS